MKDLLTYKSNRYILYIPTYKSVWNGKEKKRKVSEKKKMGRPIVGEPKDVRLTVRLDKSTYEKLMKYCNAERLGQSELIRKLINNYKN